MHPEDKALLAAHLGRQLVIAFFVPAYHIVQKMFNLLVLALLGHAFGIQVVIPEDEPLERKTSQLRFGGWPIEGDIYQDTAIDCQVDPLLIDSLAGLAIQALAHKSDFLGMPDTITDAEVVHQALKDFGLR